MEELPPNQDQVGAIAANGSDRTSDTVSLGSYIRSNEPLLNAFGVLAAIVVVAAELLPARLAFAVSFVVLILVFLVAQELTSAAPNDAFHYIAMSERSNPHAHWRLAIFATVLLFATFLLPIYHFFVFYDYWRLWLPILLSILAALAVFTQLGRVFPVLKVRPYWEVGIQRTVGLGLLLMLLIVVFAYLGPLIFESQIDPLIRTIRISLEESVR